MPTIREILEALGDDTLLADGANDRSAEIILMDEDAEFLDQPAGWQANDICLVDKDGFLAFPGVLRLVDDNR
jgi:hypothetical protein